MLTALLTIHACFFLVCQKGPVIWAGWVDREWSDGETRGGTCMERSSGCWFSLLLPCFSWSLQAAVVHLPVSLSAGSPFALDVRARPRPLEPHRQLPGQGEGHCCLQWLCPSSLSAGRQQVPLRASSAFRSTWHCSPSSFPYHSRSNLLISETGKSLIFFLVLHFSFAVSCIRCQQQGIYVIVAPSPRTM